jgi:formylglycine-generating enzyme required for sulfatase activity
MKSVPAGWVIAALWLASCQPQGPMLKATSSSVPATPSPTPLHRPGDLRRDQDGIQQVWVPAGSFLMGTASADGLTVPPWAKNELASEMPQHQVQLTHGFWLDRFEVTNGAFQAFVDAGGYTQRRYWSDAGWDWLTHQIAHPPRTCDQSGAEFPRACVTWHEAQAYATWRGGRLPTEAEWEFAARGPQSLIYPWGNTWEPALANVVDSQGSQPVGSYPGGASWVGALDMSGNLMEWVQDWLDSHYYEASPAQDPPGPDHGFRKVEKGGWWGSVPFTARAAYRHFEDPPEYQDHHIGFRVLTPEEYGVP